VSVDRDCWRYYQTESAVVILEKTAVLPTNPVISFALLLVEAEKNAEAISGSLFELQKDISEHGA
jgi:hypothetical protein